MCQAKVSIARKETKFGKKCMKMTPRGLRQHQERLVILRILNRHKSSGLYISCEGETEGEKSWSRECYLYNKK